MASTFSNGIAHADAFPSEDDHLHWLALRMTLGLGNPKGRTTDRDLPLSPGDFPGFPVGAGGGGALGKRRAKHLQRMRVRGRRYAASKVNRARDITDPPGRPWLSPSAARNLRSTARPVRPGRVDLLQSLMLSIVGTRRPTAYGTAASSPTRQGSMPGRAYYRLAEWLVASTQPRTGPRWKRGGDTFAVFGCGVDEFIRLKTGSLLRRSQRKG